MKRAVSSAACGYGACSVSFGNEPSVATIFASNISSTHNIAKPGGRWELPRFDDRIRALLHYGEIARVKAELKKIQGDAGLVIFSVATHGDWLQILSGKRNAVQYVIGNVLVSTQMTQHELAAGLYAPLRIMLYENKAGTTTFEYYKPSTLFGQYGDERVTTVAKDLDQKIYDALIKTAK